jgi:hypothetical protein
VQAVQVGKRRYCSRRVELAPIGFQSPARQAVQHERRVAENTNEGAPRPNRSSSKLVDIAASVGADGDVLVGDVVVNEHIASGPSLATTDGRHGEHTGGSSVERRDLRTLRLELGVNRPAEKT